VYYRVYRTTVSELVLLFFNSGGTDRKRQMISDDIYQMKVDRDFSNLSFIQRLCKKPTGFFFRWYIYHSVIYVQSCISDRTIIATVTLDWELIFLETFQKNYNPELIYLRLITSLNKLSEYLECSTGTFIGYFKLLTILPTTYRDDQIYL